MHRDNRPLTRTPRLRRRVSVPSQAGALGDCGINQKPLAIVFTSGKEDSGLYLFALWVKSRWRLLIFCLYNIMNNCDCDACGTALRLAGWGTHSGPTVKSRQVRQHETRDLCTYVCIQKVSIFKPTAIFYISKDRIQATTKLAIPSLNSGC